MAYTMPVQLGYTITAAHPYALSSRHAGGVPAALMDGSVRTISSGTTTAILNLALFPNDGGVLPSNW